MHSYPPEENHILPVKNLSKVRIARGFIVKLYRLPPSLTGIKNTGIPVNAESGTYV